MEFLIEKRLVELMQCSHFSSQSALNNFTVRDTARKLDGKFVFSKAKLKVRLQFNKVETRGRLVVVPYDGFFFSN